MGCNVGADAYNLRAMCHLGRHHSAVCLFRVSGSASIGTSLVLTALNMLMLSYAMKGIPMGTAYAVWTGLGAVGITLLGILFFKDPATLSRLAFMGLVVIGIVGLKLTASPA